MNEKEEQGMSVKWDKTITQTFIMLTKAVGGMWLSVYVITNCMQEFKEGRTSSGEYVREDRQRQPKTLMSPVNSFLFSNRRLTMHKIAELCRVSQGLCQKIQ